MSEELGPYPYPATCINCGQSSVESLAVRITDLERQLAEAQRKLEAVRVEVADFLGDEKLERLENIMAIVGVSYS